MTELRPDRAPAPTATLRRISWGGILAGAILALMLQFMLGLFGLGVGLTSASSGAGGIVSLAGLWAVFIVLIGVFAGAYAAARFSGIPSRVDGMLHGVVTWAVTGLLALYLLTSGAASLVGGAFGVLGQSIDDLTTSAEALTARPAAMTNALDASAELLFAPAPASASGDGAEPAPQAGAAAQSPVSATDRQAVRAEVAAALAAKDDEAMRGAAVEAIARAAGVDRAEAERRFSAFGERAAKAKSDMEAQRSAAASALARASLAAFVALLLGMVVGGLGGMLGRPGRVAGDKPSRH